MNFAFILSILIWFHLPIAFCDLMMFRNLINIFRNPIVKPSNKQSDLLSLRHSSLISKDDNKFSSAGHFFKNGLFRNNFIVHFQDMISKKSTDKIEENSIVNDDDQQYPNDDYESDQEDEKVDLDTVNKLANDLTINQPIFLHDESTDEDDDEYDENEDEFHGEFHNKNLKSQNNETQNLFTSHVNDTINNQIVHHLNQSNITFNSTHNNQTDKVSSRYSVKSRENLDSVSQIPKKNSLSENIEKILDKYTFLNLYPAPTINDTHNDRDLHQKGDKMVVLKANFADYVGYANTEKSLIVGETIKELENSTDISYGNFRIHKIHTEDLLRNETKEV